MKKTTPDELDKALATLGATKLERRKREDELDEEEFYATVPWWIKPLYGILFLMAVAFIVLLVKL